LAEVVAGRTATSITFTWNEGFDNGGSPVYDYRLWIAAGDGEWQQLAEDITVTTYTATGLTAGINYRFRVEAQNANGYGPFSDVVSILCATRPETPVQP
jgi:hypothetical protein